MPGGLSPPYPELTRCTDGRLEVIPFPLGAGAPLYAQIPRRPSGSSSAGKGRNALSDFLPTAGELAEYLAVRTHLTRRRARRADEDGAVLRGGAGSGAVA